MRELTDILEVAPAPDRSLRRRLGAWLRDLTGTAETLPAEALPALTLQRFEVRLGHRVDTLQGEPVTVADAELWGGAIVVTPEGVVGGGTIAEALDRVSSQDALAAAARWELQAMGETRPEQQASFVAVAEASLTGESPGWRTRRRLRRRRLHYYHAIAELARSSLKAIEAEPFVRLAEVYAGWRVEPPEPWPHS